MYLHHPPVDVWCPSMGSVKDPPETGDAMDEAADPAADTAADADAADADAADASGVPMPQQGKFITALYLFKYVSDFLNNIFG